MSRIKSLAMAGLVLLSSFAPSLARAEDLPDELRQIQEREQEIENNQNILESQLSQIQSAQMDIDEAFVEIDRLTEERKVLEKEIEELSKEIKKLEEDIKVKEKEKSDLEAELEEKIKIFKKRLDVMYKNRNSGTISLLLEADNAEDFLARVNGMKAIADYDRDMIREMNALKKELDLVIINLKGTKASRDQAQENLLFKEASVLDSISDQNSLVAVLRANQDLAQEEVARLNSVVDRLNEEIDQLNLDYQERLRREEEERRRQEEERRRQEEERRKAEAAKRAEANSLSAVSYSYEPEIDANYTPFDGEIVYFNQREEPWGSYPYGNGFFSSIAANGCGPTSMAMVVSSLTDQYTTPSEMADFSTRGGHVMPGDGGSLWSLFPAAASAYGLNCTQTSNQDTINEALSQGALVVCSMNNSLGGYWTIGGHFIVLTGIDENGYISVADPWSRAKSVIKHNQLQVYTPLRSAWIITG